MDPADLISARFWESDENHIALNPLRPADGEGLHEFAWRTLGARGWCFFQTSGSEGTPKWVALTKEAFLISARSVNELFAVTAADRWLVPLPLHHVGGFSIYARCFVSGATAHPLSGRWDAAESARACEEKSITLTSLVPTQVFDLVQSDLPAPKSLRAVIVGGGALPPPLRDRALALGWPVCRSYGMTEAASQIATQSGDDFFRAHPDAMQVLPHWQLSTDGDDILTVRGPALAKGCASRDPGGSWQWQPIDPADGLRTRDRVRLSQQGGRALVEFIGRDASFVKISGELVNCDALQLWLDAAVAATRFPTAAVLVPIADERRETRLAIAVEAGKSTLVQRAELHARFNATGLPFERADAVSEIETMPRSSIGKPLLAEVAAMMDAVLQRRSQRQIDGGGMMVESERPSHDRV